MIKIRISYSDECELKKVISLLNSEIRKVKKSKKIDRKYKKAYIELKDDKWTL